MKKVLFMMAALICLLKVQSAFADRLDQMISPVSNPVNFDDPRSNTEARFIYMYHEIDNDFITEGGDIRVYALQLRYAVDDRLALLATKDGYVDFNPDAVLQDESGFANVSVGAKYAVYKDDENGIILTPGLRYEIPMGESEVFQGKGDGFIQPFFSSGVALSDRSNFIGATGLRLPLDNAD
ncbi:MAG: hypothetical protein KDD53_03555, partial [Bdellovibrionales bacterium]|nr:hypothetical protein [Bdellovibrionales bacterium]